MGELRRRLPNHVSKIYYPLDRRKFVNRAIATINPKAVVLVEAEIWPNFIWRAHRLSIPVLLVNARLSERSFPRYKKLAFLFRPCSPLLKELAARTKRTRSVSVK